MQKMNKSLHNITEYLKINKLKLNVTKKKCMMIITTPFKHKNININEVIKIEDNIDEWVTESKYLGFLLDSHLSFNSHLQKKI